MNVADGNIIGTFMPTHNHQDWIRFLKLIHQQTPQDKEVHLVLDNYLAHKTPEVLQWLTRHRRFHLHFTPTSSSWCNHDGDQTKKSHRHPVYQPAEDQGEPAVRYHSVRF
jgi:hypothetical protein